MPGSGGIKPEYFRWDASDNMLPASPDFVDLASVGRVENNRVVEWQDIRIEFDGIGRMSKKVAGDRQILTLKWNRENQLIESENEQFGILTKTRYHYDALGRRIGKTTRFVTTWFNWAGMRMVEEELGSRITTTVYEDQDSYAPLARIEHAKDNQAITEKQIFYYHTDINGAPEELTSYLGDVAWKARYRTWGNTVIEEWDQQFQRYDGTWQFREQNLRMQGQYRDSETGLHYNTFRYFDPDIGRFASQDPIGLEGGLNLYQYAPNPSQWIDPWGLAKELCDTGPYSKTGGHHPHMQAAFADLQAKGIYKPGKAFSLSNKFMEKNGWDHQTMTNYQRSAFTDLAKVNKGRPGTMEQHSQIAKDALRAGGVPPKLATKYVQKSLDSLTDMGIKKPSNMPYLRK